MRAQHILPPVVPSTSKSKGYRTPGLGVFPTPSKPQEHGFRVGRW